jgi:hypothetical protein
MNSQAITIDTLWNKYRIDEAGDTVIPVLVKKEITAFDTIQPCDIKLLDVGDTSRSASFVGTIKPNVCAGYSPSADDISITCTDSIMWAFTTYALLKLCFKVAFWPRAFT